MKHNLLDDVLGSALDTHNKETKRLCMEEMSRLATVNDGFIDLKDSKRAAQNELLRKRKALRFKKYVRFLAASAAIILVTFYFTSTHKTIDENTSAQKINVIDKSLKNEIVPQNNKQFFSKWNIESINPSDDKIKFSIDKVNLSRTKWTVIVTDFPEFEGFKTYLVRDLNGVSYKFVAIAPQ